MTAIAVQNTFPETQNHVKAIVARMLIGGSSTKSFLLLKFNDGMDTTVGQWPYWKML